MKTTRQNNQNNETNSHHNFTHRRRHSGVPTCWLQSGTYLKHWSNSAECPFWYQQLTAGNKPQLLGTINIWTKASPINHLTGISLSRKQQRSYIRTNRTTNIATDTEWLRLHSHTDTSMSPRLSSNYSWVKRNVQTLVTQSPLKIWSNTLNGLQKYIPLSPVCCWHRMYYWCQNRVISLPRAV